MSTKYTCCGVTFSRGCPSKCTRLAKVEVEGKHYCGIHNPIAIAEKNSIKHAEWEAKHEAIDAARAANKAKQAEIERRADCYPELLEALQYLLEREWQDDDFDETLINARDKAKAAIAKALGEVV